MTATSLSYSVRASQSPVHTYNRDGRTITEGYDLPTAKYWYRIGFGWVREFNSQREMENTRDHEFLPSTLDHRSPNRKKPTPPVPAGKAGGRIPGKGRQEAVRKAGRGWALDPDKRGAAS